MTDPLTLVVLAAGLGSRFGGPKQLAALGPGGSTLMDYGLYDGWRAGFRRAVFVIRPELAELFERTIGQRYAGRMEVRVAFQRMEALPDGRRPPPGRERPWGTTHAVLAAAPFLAGAFAVLNADDFYGREAFAALADCLGSAAYGPSEHAVIGYRLEATASPAGGVNRALLDTDAAGRLCGITELRELRPDGLGWFAGRSGDDVRRVPSEALVSMNLWGFRPTIFPPLRSAFTAFLAAGPGPDAESYLPDAVGQAIASGAATVRVLPTSSTWCGVTHAEDRGWVEARLRRAVDAGDYPEQPWA